MQLAQAKAQECILLELSTSLTPGTPELLGEELELGKLFFSVSL